MTASTGATTSPAVHGQSTDDHHNDHRLLLQTCALFPDLCRPASAVSAHEPLASYFVKFIQAMPSRGPAN